MRQDVYYIAVSFLPQKTIHRSNTNTEKIYFFRQLVETKEKEEELIPDSDYYELLFSYYTSRGKRVQIFEGISNNNTLHVQITLSLLKKRK